MFCFIWENVVMTGQWPPKEGDVDYGDHVFQHQNFTQYGDEAFIASAVNDSSMAQWIRVYKLYSLRASY